MKYLAFDIEIAKDFNRLSFETDPPNEGETIEVCRGNGYAQAVYRDGAVFLLTNPGEKFTITPDFVWRPAGKFDWGRFRPFGITCAAAMGSDGRQWLWYGREPLGNIAPRMREDEIQRIINNLMDLAADGYNLLTWNGLGFDFKVLAEEGKFPHKCGTLALDHHIDMMFQFFCEKGYGLGLDDAAKGMGLPGKPEGMDGAKAPELWPVDPLRVMHYCMTDCKNTLDLAEVIDEAGELSWISKKGRPNRWKRNEWLTAKACLDIPEPNTSWMKDPWPREKFYGWTGYKPSEVRRKLDTPL